MGTTDWHDDSVCRHRRAVLSRQKQRRNWVCKFLCVGRARPAGRYPGPLECCPRPSMIPAPVSPPHVDRRLPRTRCSFAHRRFPCANLPAAFAAALVFLTLSRLALGVWPLSRVQPAGGLWPILVAGRAGLAFGCCACGCWTNQWWVGGVPYLRPLHLRCCFWQRAARWSIVR